MNLNEFERAQLAYNKTQLIEYDYDEIIKSFDEIINYNEKEILGILQKDNNYYSSFDISNVLKSRKNSNNIEALKRESEDSFITSIYRDNFGVLGIIFDGNIFVTIELLKILINTKNAMIFWTNNENSTITNLLVRYFKQALKKYGYDEEIVQVINSDNYAEMYNHNNILKKLIAIGNTDLQNSVIADSKIEVLKSGFGCFDIYIENIIDFDLIKKILKEENLEVNLYISKEIEPEKIDELGIDEYTEIENIDECIRDININSAGYSSSIFTSNPDNANMFSKLVKSKNIFVNTDPTLERIFDISEEDLLYTKQVIKSK